MLNIKKTQSYNYFYKIIATVFLHINSYLLESPLENG